MKRTTIWASIFALSMIVLALPTIASAQWRDNDDDYYRNSRYNRNIRGTIQNLKNRARNFERRIDRVDDRRDNRDDDWYGGRRGRNDRYDNLDQLASQFRRATADLADEYGNGRNLNGSRDEARRVLDIGLQIDNMLYRSRGGNRQVQNEWEQIRYDLRVLSDAYGLGNYNGSGNRNRSGDWRNRVPFPLPF